MLNTNFKEYKGEHSFPSGPAQPISPRPAEIVGLSPGAPSLSRRHLGFPGPMPMIRPSGRTRKHSKYTIVTSATGNQHSPHFLKN